MCLQLALMRLSFIMCIVNLTGFFSSKYRKFRSIVHRFYINFAELATSNTLSPSMGCLKTLFHFAVLVKTVFDLVN